MPESYLSGLRICFLAGTLGQGGAERQLYHILEQLHRSGAQVTLLCLTRGEFWEERIIGLGVPCVWVGQQQNRLWRLWKIYRELRRIGPAIVQSQHFYTNFYAAAAGRSLGIPTIGAVRSDVHLEIRTNGRILGAVCLRLPHFIAANSAAAIVNASRIGIEKNKLWLVPNAVDTKRFHPAVPDNWSGPFRVLSIGRMDALKRFDLVLKSIAAFRRRVGVNIRVTLAGDGPLRAELERQAAELGLSDAVEFPGPVSDVVPLYRQADVFVLASDQEGAPNVILEAMASGLAVVATAVGGIPALITNGATGILIPPGGQDELVDAMELLAKNNSLRQRLGEQARKFAECNHAPEMVAGVLSQMYRAMLDARMYQGTGS